jgi:hypothetical protein
LNSRPTRPSETSRACAFSAAVTDREPRPRPVLMSRFVCGAAKKFLDSAEVHSHTEDASI